MRPELRKLSAARALLWLFVASPFVGTPSIAQVPAADCRLETIEMLVHRKHMMPPVVGCDAKETASALRKWDYVANLVTVHSAARAGQITTQQPDPNTPLRSDTQIALTVSDGKQATPAPPAATQHPSTPPPPKHELADVSVRMTLESPAPFRKGQTIRYLVNVHNAGPNMATSVEGNFRPKNLTILRSSTTCNGNPCTLVNRPPNATATIALEATIIDEGPFSLTATVTQAQEDPDPTNNADNSGSSTSREPPAAPPPVRPPLASAREVELTITNELIGKGPYHPGDTVTFATTVHNSSLATATNVRILDTLINLRPLRILGNCRELNCRIPRLPPNASIKRELQATINSDGEFVSQVSATADQTDPNPSNNWAIARGRAGVFPWIVVLIALSSLSAAIATTPLLRRAWWRSRIKVRPSLDEAGVSRMLNTPKLTA